VRLETDLFGHIRFAAGGRIFFLCLRFGASFGDSWNASSIDGCFPREVHLEELE